MSAFRPRRSWIRRGTIDHRARQDCGHEEVLRLLSEGERVADPTLRKRIYERSENFQHAARESTGWWNGKLI
jgi:hypothetical protein